MKYIFALLIALTISSCFFGPVKELKYQIEDSFDEGESLTEPKKILNFPQTKSFEIIWKSQIESYSDNKTHLFQAADTLFAISSSGNLSAFNAEDGLSAQAVLDPQDLNIVSGPEIPLEAIKKYDSEREFTA